ncbi:MAG: hypothetical protein H0U13_15365 [Gemmatimonadaceae bacterium]|nr:hypothetical protein [Gemmatimonadaceae bacterium]
MQSALRKIGNSTGIVLPRAILGEIGLATGATLDLKVEGGRLIGTPIRTERRAGWGEAAAAIAEAKDADSAAWAAFGNEGDADLAW